MIESPILYAEFAGRLKALMEDKNVSISDLKAIAGCTYEMARRYTMGTAKPRSPRLKKICTALHSTEIYLLFGAGPKAFHTASNSNSAEPALPNDELIYLPIIDVDLSAGGDESGIREVAVYTQPFQRHTLNKKDVTAPHAKIVRIIGNGMSPILNDGDDAGIDINKTKIVDGDSYAIRDGNLLRVKILIERPDGGLMIRSYNRDDYPDETLNKEERQSRVNVLGRVWWSSRLW